jgi:hypothetical protein
VLWSTTVWPRSGRSTVRAIDSLGFDQRSQRDLGHPTVWRTHACELLGETGSESGSTPRASLQTQSQRQWRR